MRFAYYVSEVIVPLSIMMRRLSQKAMAGERIDIMDLRQLIQLKIKGWSSRKVAMHLSVSRNTVITYIKVFEQRSEDLGDLLRLSDAELKDFFPQVDYNTDPERNTYVSAQFEY